jgi:hypothetical protein
MKRHTHRITSILRPQLSKFSISSIDEVLTGNPFTFRATEKL